ncbi:MAG: DUF4272 domain-containing protein [Deltaproteobacteria bacterium]|nr:DUF4272 domain-containing protein [Deltaproteobacteria bacterium]
MSASADPRGRTSPSPGRIAARALTLCAVIARAYLEEAAHDPHTEQLRKQMLAWLQQLDLMDELTQAERKLMERPVGRLSQREQADASWLCEGLSVLAWALGRFELPLPDSEIDPRRVVESLGFLTDGAQALLTLPLLRPEEELATAEARLVLVRERLVAFSQTREPVSLELLAKGAELGPLVLSGVPLADGDLRIDGKPLAQCEEDRWNEALDAATERARSISWLCGSGERYSLG